MNWKRIVDESSKTFDLDDSIKAKLESLNRDCKKKYGETASDDNRFRVYGYEGQELHNFWLGMGRVLSDLKNGIFTKYTVEDLENALS